MFVMLLPGLTRMGILIDFSIHQEFIASVLCIEKDQPITTCYGSCYLSDQLNKTEQQKKGQAPRSNNERVEITLFHDTQLANQPTLLSIQQEKAKGLHKCAFHPQTALSEIFHPPQAILA